MITQQIYHVTCMYIEYMATLIEMAKTEKDWQKQHCKALHNNV